MIWLPALFIVWSLFGRIYAQSIDPPLNRHNGPAPLQDHLGCHRSLGSHVPGQMDGALKPISLLPSPELPASNSIRGAFVARRPSGSIVFRTERQAPAKCGGSWHIPQLHHPWCGRAEHQCWDFHAGACDPGQAPPDRRTTCRDVRAQSVRLSIRMRPGIAGRGGRRADRAQNPGCPPAHAPSRRQSKAVAQFHEELAQVVQQTGL